jgi:hypothetical protein
MFPLSAVLWGERSPGWDAKSAAQIVGLVLRDANVLADNDRVSAALLCSHAGKSLIVNN